jgi:hypothetical protein
MSRLSARFCFLNFRFRIRNSRAIRHLSFLHYIVAHTFHSVGATQLLDAHFGLSDVLSAALEFHAAATSVT